MHETETVLGKLGTPMISVSDGNKKSLETLLWHEEFGQKERKFNSQDLHFSMSVGGLSCIKGGIKGEMSASGYAWLLGRADVCCLVDDTEAEDEFQLSYLAT